MRLSLYNGKEQREHIDEGVERLMEKNGWQQTFAPEFTRLGFGFGGVAVALYVWYLEKTVPFRDSRFYVGLLCALYFSFTWGGWLWQRYVEKNAMYIGSKEGYKTWIATSNPKNSEKYDVKVYVKTPQGQTQVHEYTFSIPELVDTSGVVHEEKLAKLLDFVSGRKTQ